jgi:non-heme chloroperoxidase
MGGCSTWETRRTVPYVRTNDGVRLFYRDEGAGPVLLILPGIAGTVAMFDRQVAGLRDRYRVVAYDHRGHGESDKPEQGYRIARLAKDLDDVLSTLDLTGVTLLGWSMGCSVAWSHLDLFGPDRVSRLILVEGHPCLCRVPGMRDGEAADVGVVFEPGAAADYTASYMTGLRRNRRGAARQLAELFCTDPGTDRDWVAGELLKLPDAAAGALLFNHLTHDWRDTVRRIAMPALVVGGGRSHVPVAAQQWLGRAIPDAQLELLPDRAHLLFYEEPRTFNALVTRFLG